jgi:hypothetical protein
VPAVAFAVEPVNEDEAFAIPAFPQTDEVTIRKAAPKRYQLLKLNLGPRVAGAIGLICLAQAFSKCEGDSLGH